VLNGSNIEVQASGITAGSIANRTRRVVLSAGDFVGAGGGAGIANFSVSPVRQTAVGPILPNTNTNVLTATFVVPNDYVAGSGVPQLTIYWSTDEGGANRRIDLDVNFTQLTNLTTSATPVTFRYNVRESSGGTDNMPSPNPNQGQVIAMTLPEAGDAYAGSPTWAPGDVIVLSIGRNGPADANNGNVYIMSVSFDYTADM
jgi:hypothetical protein